MTLQPPTTLPSVLPLPVPPDGILERAFGYTGDARYVAFYWTPMGDELMHETMRGSGTCHGWHAFLSYIRHPTIARVLGRTMDEVGLGSSEEDATHWLVLDRERAQLTVLPAPQARVFLHSQWPPSDDVLVVSPAEWQAITEQVMRRMGQQAHASLKQMVGAQLDAYEQLDAWLETLGQE